MANAPAIEREVTARWKIIAGVVIALCGTGGASTFFYYKGASKGEQFVTASDLDSFKNAIVSEMKVELKKTDERIGRAEGLGDRVLSLEKESQFNRTMLLALSAEIKPTLSSLQIDMSKALQSLEYMRAKLEAKGKE